MLGHPETERADPHEEDVGRVWRDSGKIYGGRKIKHAPGHEGIVFCFNVCSTGSAVFFRSVG